MTSDWRPAPSAISRRPAATGRGRSREAVAVVSVDRPRRLGGERQPEAARRPSGGGKKIAAAVACGLALVGSVVGMGMALQADALRVRTVSITGASPALEQAIADVVVPGCPKAADGTFVCPASHLGPNELTLSTSDIEAQVRRLPLVKTALVKAILPDKIRIRVGERQPEAAWVVGTEVLRVADDGVVIDRGSASGLKVVVGQVGGEPVKPGDTVDVGVIRAAELLQERLPADAGFTARRIQYSPADGLAVVGDQDVMAVFGAPENLNLKMAELQRILQLARENKANLGVVDLRYKTPYFRTR